MKIQFRGEDGLGNEKVYPSWRELADDGDWHSIDLRLLTTEQRKHLYREFSETVPRRKSGDGLIEYDDFLPPLECTPGRQRFAARHLRMLANREDTIAEAVSLATKILENSFGPGVDINKTLFLPSGDAKKWKLRAAVQN